MVGIQLLETNDDCLRQPQSSPSKRSYASDADEGESPPATKKAKVSITETGQENQACSSSGSAGSNLRRSSRLHGKEKPGPSTGPLTRTEKGKSTKRRRTKGFLQKLMQMPVDIFTEIAGYLGPLDLLNMARCARSLRNLLMSKDSKQIWRMSRDALRIPECPEDLSEPQYADLLFGKGCYHCGRARASLLFFSLRIRLCGNCAKENLISEDTVYDKAESMEEVYGGDVAKMIWKISPFHHKHYSEGIYLRSNHYCVLLDRVAFEGTISKYEAYLEKRTKGRKAFEEKQKEDTLQIMESSERVEAWRAAQTAKKEAERRHISKEREESIIARLKEMGYAEQDFLYYHDTGSDRRRWGKLLSEAKPLTDKVWEKILPELVQIIARRREEREKAPSIPFCPCPICQAAGVTFIDDVVNAFVDVFDGNPDDDLDDFEYDSDSDSDDNDMNLGGALATLMVYYGFI